MKLNGYSFNFSLLVGDCYSSFVGVIIVVEVYSKGVQFYLDLLVVDDRNQSVICTGNTAHS